MRTPCRIIFHAVPAGPPYFSNGPMVAVGQCETHGMQMPAAPCTQTMCPIGHIEKAVDDGIAKILSALDGKLPSSEKD